MDSFYDFIQHNPSTIRLQVNDLLLAEYQCPLDKIEHDVWSHHNYFIYVITGQKKWVTRFEQLMVGEGDCIFVRKGAHTVHQYFDKGFCAVVLFVPDGFIRSVLLDNRIDLNTPGQQEDLNAIFPIDVDPFLVAYFKSFLSYLAAKTKPPKKLLELKFKELVMVIASQKYNKCLNCYFSELCRSGKPSLSEVMEKNFQYPLVLEEFARLSARSLSAFKTEFKEEFGTSPGKWLKQKRLSYSKYLLKTTNKPVTEVVYDSGFQNTSHFSRAFKGAFNCSPLEFRNMEFSQE